MTRSEATETADMRRRESCAFERLVAAPPGSGEIVGPLPRKSGRPSGHVPRSFKETAGGTNHELPGWSSLPGTGKLRPIHDQGCDDRGLRSAGAGLHHTWRPERLVGRS